MKHKGNNEMFNYLNEERSFRLLPQLVFKGEVCSQDMRHKMLRYSRTCLRCHAEDDVFVAHRINYSEYAANELRGSISEYCDQCIESGPKMDVSRSFVEYSTRVRVVCDVCKDISTVYCDGRMEGNELFREHVVHQMSICDKCRKLIDNDMCLKYVIQRRNNEYQTVRSQHDEQLNRKFFMSNLLILISGKARHGKTTFAKNLMRELRLRGVYDTKRLPLAHELKQVAKEEYGWDGKKDDAGRALLQRIGTERRNDNEDYWCQRLHNKLCAEASISNSDVVIIDDVRYRNEVSYFDSNFKCIEVIRIDRVIEDGTPFESDLTEEQKAHKSEVDLDDAEFANRFAIEQGLENNEQAARQFVDDIVTTKLTAAINKSVEESYKQVEK